VPDPAALGDRLTTRMAAGSSPGRWPVLTTGHWIEGTIHSMNSWFSGEDPPMMIYQEKISTPLAPLSDDEQMKLVTEAIASESHWAKGLVGRIAVVIREIQQH
jgi:hypothetical protein